MGLVGSKTDKRGKFIDTLFFVKREQSLKKEGLGFDSCVEFACVGGLALGTLVSKNILYMFSTVCVHPLDFYN